MEPFDRVSWCVLSTLAEDAEIISLSDCEGEGDDDYVPYSSPKALEVLDREVPVGAGARVEVVTDIGGATLMSEPVASIEGGAVTVRAVLEAIERAMHRPFVPNAGRVLENGVSQDEIFQAAEGSVFDPKSSQFVGVADIYARGGLRPNLLLGNHVFFEGISRDSAGTLRPHYGS